MVHVWRVWHLRSLAFLCMQGVTRGHVEMKCKEKNCTFHFYSHVTSAFVYILYIAVFSRVYSYVTRMLLVCTRMSLVCFSCVVLVTISAPDLLRPTKSVWSGQYRLACFTGAVTSREETLPLEIFFVARFRCSGSERKRKSVNFCGSN